MPGHYERERAGRHWREARWELRDGTYVLVDGDWEDMPMGPTAAPPELREERWEPRRGMVWIRGRWDWRGGNWEWLPGHYERERAGQRWTEGRWEMREGRYVWVEGVWGAPLAWPPLDQPPPAPRVEQPMIEPGTEWVPGHWIWVDGRYEWQPGKASPIHPGMHFEVGEWVRESTHWSWRNGNWFPNQQVVRMPAPPPPIEEDPGAPRSGFVWVRGHHQWINNRYEWVAGHWERERANLRWYDGRWEQRGDQWVWIEGGWR
jgi:hypothetical protein